MACNMIDMHTTGSATSELSVWPIPESCGSRRKEDRRAPAYDSPRPVQIEEPKDDGAALINQADVLCSTDFVGIKARGIQLTDAVEFQHFREIGLRCSSGGPPVPGQVGEPCNGGEIRVKFVDSGGKSSNYQDEPEGSKVQDGENPEGKIQQSVLRKNEERVEME
ncbi:hypothetical protein C8R44DRAFT_738941 [Mycena epipterygia]|nr:hypothetical protein C8R44DRAFT_738941 [Mycena epipterygia]